MEGCTCQECNPQLHEPCYRCQELEAEARAEVERLKDKEKYLLGEWKNALRERDEARAKLKSVVDRLAGADLRGGRRPARRG